MKVTRLGWALLLAAVAGAYAVSFAVELFRWPCKRTLDSDPNWP